MNWEKYNQDVGKIQLIKIIIIIAGLLFVRLTTGTFFP